MYFNEKTAASIIGKMLKQKELKSRPALQHTWIDEQGRQCSCDGFRAYRLNMPVAGLPDMPAELNAVPLEKIFPDVAKMQALDTPALAELDALIADDNLQDAESELNTDYGLTLSGKTTGGTLSIGGNPKKAMDILTKLLNK